MVLELGGAAVGEVTVVELRKELLKEAALLLVAHRRELFAVVGESHSNGRLPHGTAAAMDQNSVALNCMCSVIEKRTPIGE